MSKDKQTDTISPFFVCGWLGLHACEEWAGKLVKSPKAIMYSDHSRRRSRPRFSKSVDRIRVDAVRRLDVGRILRRTVLDVRGAKTCETSPLSRFGT
jgi:hypothetical protein